MHFISFHAVGTGIFGSKFLVEIHVPKHSYKTKSTNSFSRVFVQFANGGSISGEKKTAQCAVFHRADSNPLNKAYCGSEVLRNATLFRAVPYNAKKIRRSNMKKQKRNTFFRVPFLLRPKSEPEFGGSEGIRTLVPIAR